MFNSETERHSTTVTTDWSPLKRGGTNFRTHRFVLVDSMTARFKPTKGAYLFFSVFLLFGIVPAAIGIHQLVKHSYRINVDVLVPLGFGIVFCSIGLLLWGFGTRPIVFDRTRGYFWKGRKDPDAVWNKDELKHFCELKKVSGLQIVGELVRSDKSTFTSYELNLVLKDGSRMNVIDHGNEAKLREDAGRLADFLDVPLIGK